MEGGGRRIKTSVVFGYISKFEANLSYEILSLKTVEEKGRERGRAFLLKWLPVWTMF